MQQRVVVTGMGAVSPLGLDVASLWQGIVEGRSGIGAITLFDPAGLDTTFAGEIKGFDAANYMDRKEVRRLDRYIHLAVAATREALHSSELTITPENRDEIGVFIGSGIGGIETLADQIEVLRARGPGRVSPFLVPAMITNMAAGMVSILTGARGPNLCTTSACATAAHAIGEAAETIRRGWAQAIIAGGSEAPITPIGVAAFNSSRALSTRNDSPATASRPFDSTRDGFVLSEGAAVLVLESLEHALGRGAPILAEIVSYGASADAYHMTALAEDGNGVARAINAALKHGGVHADEIDHINAHATSTPAGDPVETLAIKTVFGERVRAIPISANKSQFGHLLGAAGSIEAIVSILTIQHGLLPATINLHTPDPACDLDYVPNTPRQARIDTVLSNSFGFGGHNVALVIRRYSE
ncbi:MAG: beta-ketoacyl-ACP synthase II [Chloroflexales bacterium]|nr:beta-ketoacyl-ACP synthase II [Chloroflexales bacterium]